MKINKDKWNQKRTEIEATIREMKSRQRERYQPKWIHGKDEDLLWKAKFSATLLYRFRAGLKGKVHVKNGESETQEWLEVFGKQHDLFRSEEPELLTGT